MKSLDLTPQNPYIALKQYEGQYLKYNQLCSIINEEPKQGNSKKSHLRKLSQYIDFEKDGGKIYIHQVYDSKTELEIISNNNKYTKYIEQFLLNLFYELKKTENLDYVVLTNRDILESTYMVNKDYFIGRNAPYRYIDHFALAINNNDMPDEQYIVNRIIDESNIFFSGSYRLLKRIIRDSLKLLEKKSLIMVNKTFRLYKNVWDDNGVFHSEYHNCTEDEVDRILAVQHKSVKEFNAQVEQQEKGTTKYFLRNATSVHYLYPRQRREYYKILNHNLKEEFAEEGWNAYSVAWKLNLTKVECFEEERKQLNYSDLNANVQQKLLTAKDLDLLENVLREQFVETFIKI